jgi:hypothetical protein
VIIPCQVLTYRYITSPLLFFVINPSLHHYITTSLHIIHSTAKDATAAWYRPLLMITNLVYMILLLGLIVGRRQQLQQQQQSESSIISATTSIFSWLPYGLWGCTAMMVTWGLQYYAYIGILEQAANTHTTNKTKKSTGSRRNNNKSDLVGGMYLDLLGLTLVIQYLTVLHTSQWFWLLMSIPIYGLYSLYTTFSTGATAKMQ